MVRDDLQLFHIRPHSGSLLVGQFVLVQVALVAVMC